jgi:hypothetical protein
MSLSSSRISQAGVGSRFPVGSSHKSSGGLVTIARGDGDALLFAQDSSTGYRLALVRQRDLPQRQQRAVLEVPRSPVA